MQGQGAGGEPSPGRNSPRTPRDENGWGFSAVGAGWSHFHPAGKQPGSFDSLVSQHKPTKLQAFRASDLGLCLPPEPVNSGRFSSFRLQRIKRVAHITETEPASGLA